MKRNMVLIPARGGSKGVPQKNLRVVGGKPLIYWSIIDALKSRHVDRVIVSTDCMEIAQVAQKFGAEVPFLRPEYCARDESSTEDVIYHCLKHFGGEGSYFPDSVVLLQPTSPYRIEGTIDRSIEYFYNNDLDSLLSAVPSHHFLWKYEAPGNVRASYDYKNRVRRQDFDSSSINHIENGSIYIFKAHDFLSFKNRLFGKIGIYEMSELEMFEIDSWEDLQLLNKIMSLRDL